ncbi:unnamed protein product [Caenorhabditis sp. 36 PRJEB53466]|nr:unnamed protein product [Caenorhabditis sp. 36 PRJEB53466]
MCPCILFDKLKNAFGKKKKKKETEQSSKSSNSGPVTESPVESKKNSKRSKRSKKSKMSKSRREQPSSQNSEDSKVKEVIETKETLLGQVFNTKPDPKDFALRVIQADRPDLVTPELKLTPDELKALELSLLKNGEMRGGISLELGNVVDCDDEHNEVGQGDHLEMVVLWAHGRFGAIYLITRHTKDKEGDPLETGLPMILKASRRMYASARIENEIATLRYLQDKSRPGKLKDVPMPTKITPMPVFGTAGGAPYFLMPVMDANLEKIRQEIKCKVPWSDAFYIGQEAMIGIKQCHEHLLVHRDIKPTNLLLSIEFNRDWWLCDFGDACPIGEKKMLSPPDALTLPFLSRTAHKAISEPVTADVIMDIESWFYMLLDMFIGLPWKKLTEESETLASKIAFWSSIDDFFKNNSAKLPPQLFKITQVIGNGFKNKPYSQLTAALREGFTQYNEKPPWKPVWIEKRPTNKVSATAQATASTQHSSSSAAPPPKKRKEKNNPQKSSQKQQESISKNQRTSSTA